MADIINQIYDTFKENDVCVDEVWQDAELPAIYYITIDGDWKHSHIFADHLMKQLNLHKIGEKDLVEDGSDWYQSTHIYILF